MTKQENLDKLAKQYLNSAYGKTVSRKDNKAMTNYIFKKTNTVHQYLYNNPYKLVDDVLNNDFGENCVDRIEIERFTNGVQCGFSVRTEKVTEIESIINDRTVFWSESEDSDDKGLYELIIEPLMNRAYNELQKFYALNDVDDGYTIMIHEKSKNDYIQECIRKLKVYKPIWEMFYDMQEFLKIAHYDD